MPSIHSQDENTPFRPTDGSSIPSLAKSATEAENGSDVGKKAVREEIINGVDHGLHVR